MNPQDARAVAGLQGDGTKGGTKNCGRDASALLIDRLADAVRDLLVAGPPPLPDGLRADLLRLAAGDDATRSPHAGKLVGERAGLDDATDKGARHGEA